MKLHYMLKERKIQKNSNCQKRLFWNIFLPKHLVNDTQGIRFWVGIRL